jgi:ADP-heptose:LPS heptosyltransferase
VGLAWAEQLIGRYSHLFDRFVEVPCVPHASTWDRLQPFLSRQREQRFDIAIQFYGPDPISNQFILGFGADLAAGFFTHPGSKPPALSVGVACPDELPEVLRNLALTDAMGCPRLGTRLEFPLSRTDWAEALKLLEGMDPAGRPTVAIHAGAGGGPARRWSGASFAWIADELARGIDAQIISTGTRAERDLGSYVASLTKAADLRDLVGHDTLGSLGAILASVDLLVSNDTGVAHLADAVNTPTVTIFGPGNARRWKALKSTTHVALTSPVLRTEVLDAALRLLDHKRS